MLKHEDLMKLFIVKLPPNLATRTDCDVYAFGFTGENAHMVKHAYYSKSINPELAMIFQAAPLLYQVINGQQQAMKRFEEALRNAGQKELAAEFADVYSVLGIAIDSATKGVEYAHEQIELRKVLYDAQQKGKSN